MRLIDADELIVLELDGISFVPKDFIDEAPTIDPVRHGYWIEEPYTESLVTKRCSECMKVAVITSEGTKVGNYCLNCGAKMDGGKDE